MNNVTELVHIGLNNDNAIKVSDTAGPIDFISNGVTEITLLLDGTWYSSNERYIKFFDGGRIEFYLQDIGLKGFYQSSMLKAIDETHPKGQPIYSDRTQSTLSFNFV